MDILMKIMMGGWIPESKRTQWTAFGAALTGLVTSFFAMGTGDVSAQAFLQEVAARWPIFAGAYGLWFLAEKVDRKS